MSSPYGPPSGQSSWQGGPPSWPPQPQQPQHLQQAQHVQQPQHVQQAGAEVQSPPQHPVPQAAPQPEPQQSQPQPQQPQPQQPQQLQQPQWGAQWQPPQHRPVPAAPPGEDPASGAPPGPGPERPPRRRARLPWLLGGGAAVVVLAAVAVLGFVAPGWFVRPVFHTVGVQKGIAQTLREAYRISGVEQVRCPDGQTVAAGRQFDCRVRIDGETRVVTISVKNDRGVYEVGHPK